MPASDERQKGSNWLSKKGCTPRCSLAVLYRKGSTRFPQVRGACSKKRRHPCPKKEVSVFDFGNGGTGIKPSHAPYTLMCTSISRFLCSLCPVLPPFDVLVGLPGTKMERDGHFQNGGFLPAVLKWRGPFWNGERWPFSKWRIFGSQTFHNLAANGALDMPTENGGNLQSKRRHQCY